MTGIDRIAAERRRQIDVEGWTPWHDDTHVEGQLVGAAINYAYLARFIAVFNRHDGALHFGGLPPRMAEWPRGWDSSWWKPDYADPIRNLEKAGALIAAEIDRLQRKAQTP